MRCHLSPENNAPEPCEVESGRGAGRAMKRLTATPREQQAEVARLDAAVAANLEAPGFGEDS